MPGLQGDAHNVSDVSNVTDSDDGGDGRTCTPPTVDTLASRVREPLSERRRRDDALRRGEAPPAGESHRLVFNAPAPGAARASSRANPARGKPTGPRSAAAAAAAARAQRRGVAPAAGPGPGVGARQSSRTRVTRKASNQSMGSGRGVGRGRGGGRVGAGAGTGGQQRAARDRAGAHSAGTRGRESGRGSRAAPRGRAGVAGSRRRATAAGAANANANATPPGGGRASARRPAQSAGSASSAQSRHSGGAAGTALVQDGLELVDRPEFQKPSLAALNEERRLAQALLDELNIGGSGLHLSSGGGSGGGGSPAARRGSRSSAAGRGGGSRDGDGAVGGSTGAGRDTQQQQQPASPSQRAGGDEVREEREERLRVAALLSPRRTKAALHAIKSAVPSPSRAPPVHSPSRPANAVSVSVAVRPMPGDADLDDGGVGAGGGVHGGMAGPASRRRGLGDTMLTDYSMDFEDDLATTAKLGGGAVGFAADNRAPRHATTDGSDGSGEEEGEGKAGSEDRPLSRALFQREQPVGDGKDAGSEWADEDGKVGGVLDTGGDESKEGKRASGDGDDDDNNAGGDGGGGGVDALLDDGLASLPSQTFNRTTKTAYTASTLGLSDVDGSVRLRHGVPGDAGAEVSLSVGGATSSRRLLSPHGSKDDGEDQHGAGGASDGVDLHATGPMYPTPGRSSGAAVASPAGSTGEVRAANTPSDVEPQSTGCTPEARGVAPSDAGVGGDGCDDDDDGDASDGYSDESFEDV